MSDCPPKDEMAKKDWAIKKGMQMVQGLNNEASATSEDETHNDENEGKDEKRKHVHWSSV